MLTPFDLLPPPVRGVVAAMFPRLVRVSQCRGLPRLVIVAPDPRVPAAALRRAGFRPALCGHWAWAPTVN